MLLIEAWQNLWDRSLPVGNESPRSSSHLTGETDGGAMESAWGSNGLQHKPIERAEGPASSCSPPEFHGTVMELFPFHGYP